LGGAVFASAAQNVFTNQLIKNLMSRVPEFNAAEVLTAGATEIKNIVPKEYLTQVISAYNDAITQTFYVSVALAALAAFPLIFVQWISVKGKKIEMAVA
jgi:hypothetical protein